MLVETASAIYDILKEECHAREIHRADFIQDQAGDDPAREWRFIGSLGFGGKFRRVNGKWYVDCYREDENQLRMRAIDLANARLLLLQRSVELQEIKASMQVISEPGALIAIKTFKMPESIQEQINNAMRAKGSP